MAIIYSANPEISNIAIVVGYIPIKSRIDETVNLFHKCHFKDPCDGSILDRLQTFLAVSESLIDIINSRQDDTLQHYSVFPEKSLGNKNDSHAKANRNNKKIDDILSELDKPSSLFNIFYNPSTNSPLSARNYALLWCGFTGFNIKATETYHNLALFTGQCHSLFQHIEMNNPMSIEPLLQSIANDEYYFYSAHL